MKVMTVCFTQPMAFNGSMKQSISNLPPPAPNGGYNIELDEETGIIVIKKGGQTWVTHIQTAMVLLDE